MCVLAFLSDGNRVPKANILLYPLVLLWPSQPGRHAQHQSFAFEHHCLAPRAMVGNLSKDKHLSQAWKGSMQDVFIFFASLPPWPPSSLWRSRCRWQTVLLQGEVGQAIATCPLLQRAGGSLSWWICHLQLTWGHTCMRTKVPSHLSSAPGS